MRIEDWLLKSENKTPFSILDDNGLWSWDVLRQRAHVVFSAFFIKELPEIKIALPTAKNIIPIIKNKKPINKNTE